MSISIIIPQIFYDIIARVLPGYLFIFTLGTSIYNDAFWFNQFECSQTNSFYIFFIIINIFILSYFAGWILRTISYHGMDHMIAKIKQDSPTIGEKYQMIRFKNPDAGFRIIKLRAEVRMLEASRNGLILISMLSILQFIIDKSDLSSPILWIFVTKFIVLLLLAMIFQKAIGPAFHNYIGNISSVYELMNCLPGPERSDNAAE